MLLKPLSEAEQKLVDAFNAKKETYTHDWLIGTLKSLLGTAVQVELATIPIYLYTYYSILRLPSYNGCDLAGNEITNPTFPTPFIPTSVKPHRALELQLFANEAGAAYMSIAVEEMLHMGIVSNILFALGSKADLYLHAPNAYPTNLPGHNGMFRPYADRPDSEHHTFEIPMSLDLKALSYGLLNQTLMIEWPEDPEDYPEAPVDDGPIQEDDVAFDTIGQVYSYIRCLISTDLVTDADFAVGDMPHQMQAEYYAPNNIDTIYAKEKWTPGLTPSSPSSAAQVSGYENASDSHHGRAELLTVHSKKSALKAIATICDQGEGISLSDLNADRLKLEKSHYYKFAALRARLASDTSPFVPLKGDTPAPSADPIKEEELGYIVYPIITNPVLQNFAGDPASLAIVAACDGLFQYMLLLTEKIFATSGDDQRGLFYMGLHNSMIWILDKMIQAMRGVAVGGVIISPTFGNIDLGDDPYSFLKGLAVNALKAIGTSQSYGSVPYYLKYIAGQQAANPPLPDVNDPKTWAFPGKK